MVFIVCFFFYFNFNFSICFHKLRMKLFFDMTCPLKSFFKRKYNMSKDRAIQVRLPCEKIVIAEFGHRRHGLSGALST